MRKATRQALFLAGILGLGLPAAAAVQRGGASLTVLVDGQPRREYVAGDTVYIEALKGQEYQLELRNPYPFRVAVALAVDGLNTIDARHTDAWSARKWVLEPYGSTVISGWQVDESAARHFYFTGERRSYGAALGETANLGNIEAVFYREREVVYRRPEPRPQPYEEGDRERKDDSYKMETRDQSDSRGQTGAVPPAPKSAQPDGNMRSEAQKSAPDPSLSDDYAATGMGSRTRHDVYKVAMDLDPRPLATLRLRYEFRAQLVKLGLMPRLERPIERRERSSGFSPQPDRY